MKGLYECQYFSLSVNGRCDRSVRVVKQLYRLIDESTNEIFATKVPSVRIDGVKVDSQGIESENTVSTNRIHNQGFAASHVVGY
jgi:hypothetical protein